MKKLDISLIKKYVNGEDLGEYSVEQLENDADFMIGVISYTNDIKMYSFCSETVKQNYEFVKYLVIKFKNNTEFITKVADYYLENNDTDLERKELSIIMEKITSQENTKKYELENSTSYHLKRLEIELMKLKEERLNSLLEMGFWLIFDEYNSSEIILDYYAKSMINEIIKDNDINFEKMLHNQFKSYDEFNKIGINNYIINFISCYDSMLSSYVSTHLDIINPIANSIKNIKDNWSKYLSSDESIRYNNMLDMVHEYMYISNSNMIEKEILYYVAKELGIVEKVKQYDGTNKLEEDYDIAIDDYDYEVVDDSINFEIKNNLKERLTYLNVKKIMINQLFSDKPLDLYSLIDDDNGQLDGKPKCKIINIDPKN